MYETALLTSGLLGQCLIIHRAPIHDFNIYSLQYIYQPDNQCKSVAIRSDAAYILMSSQSPHRQNITPVLRISSRPRKPHVDCISRHVCKLATSKSLAVIVWSYLEAQESRYPVSNVAFEFDASELFYTPWLHYEASTSNTSTTQTLWHHDLSI